MRRRHGFTLIELLVVISIIALLVGILLPSLGKARTAANMTVELAAARQLALAQHMYADANDELFIRARQDEIPSNWTDENGNAYNPATDFFASRWPHRLANFMGGGYKGYILVNDTERLDGGSSLNDIFESQEPFAGFNLSGYWVSLCPSFGLNSYFVGGHAHWTDADEIARVESGDTVLRPASAPIATSDMVAFASGRYELAGGVPVETNPEIVSMQGFYYIEAPTVDGGWSTADFDRFASGYDEYGNIDVRYDRGVITGYCDGHASVEQLDDLRSMEHWSPVAQKNGDANYIAPNTP